MTATDLTFARQLRLIRQRSGMTQRQLADAMTVTGSKMHASAIAKIEAGDRPVKIGEAVELAGILGVPLAGLLTSDTSREVLDAQLAVASLRRAADRYSDHIRQLEVLRENTIQRLAAADKRLAELQPAKATGGAS